MENKWEAEAREKVSLGTARDKGKGKAKRERDMMKEGKKSCDKWQENNKSVYTPFVSATENCDLKPLSEDVLCFSLAPSLRFVSVLLLHVSILSLYLFHYPTLCLFPPPSLSVCLHCDIELSCLLSRD